MKLTKKQKKFVKRIADPLFTVDFLEKYYCENLDTVPRSLNTSLTRVHIFKANAFMAAVNGILIYKKNK